MSAKSARGEGPRTPTVQVHTPPFSEYMYLLTVVSSDFTWLILSKQSMINDKNSVEKQMNVDRQVFKITHLNMKWLLTEILDLFIFQKHRIFGFFLIFS